MKLLSYSSITFTVETESKFVRRGDLFNPITAQFPPAISDAPPDEVIAKVYYNGLKTAEIEDAVTDMINTDAIEIEGLSYRVIESIFLNGKWKKIKCVRPIPN